MWSGDQKKSCNGYQCPDRMIGYPDMGIGVAGYPEGHPETRNRLLEMDYLKAKVDAGADYIRTQLFFDNREFYDFCERCELAGIRVPIVAGVAPVTSLKLMKRMAEVSAGTRFPAPLLRAMRRAETEEHVSNVGIHWALSSHSNLGVVGWGYPEPKPAFEKIRNYVSFYPAVLVCYVSGERARAQPGTFYGGWITREIVGPFKGEPGTEHWCKIARCTLCKSIYPINSSPVQLSIHIIECRVSF
jgi:hypothetical protein